VILVKRLDRYLLRHFFLALLLVGISCEIVFILINAVEKLSRFIDNQVPFATIVQYYVFYSGWVIRNFFPMFILLATLFSIAILARRNEILAMKSTGRSLYRIAAPILIVSLALSAGHFYYNEYIYPPIAEQYHELKVFEVEKKSKRTFTVATNIRRQIQPGHFYTIGTFDTERLQGRDLRIYRSQNNRLAEVITADQIVWENHRWVAYKGAVRTFDDTASEIYSTFESRQLDQIEEKPADFARRIGKPEDMGLEELKNYIRVMERTGGPHIRESVDLGIKYAFPLSSFIVTLICIPFASNAKRSGVAVSFAMGALIALVYFVLFRILQSAGYSEKIPWVVSVWGVNAVFLVIGLLAMLKARK
jgi:lipopolysaccharide export system permease protein